MPRLRLGDVTVHYQQIGRGPDLVLVHGLLSSLAFWYLEIAPLLARDFQVTAYDLRGHGLSEMPQRGYTTRVMAADLHAVLDALAIDQAHLVGHSFGGAVVLHYAADHPDRVRCLVAADAQVPALPPRPPGRDSARWSATIRRARSLGLDVPDDVPRVAYGFLEELTRSARIDGEPAGLRLDPGSHAHRRWRQLMERTTAARELGRVAGLTPSHIRSIGQPTLAMVGEHSFCRPTARALQRNLRQCETVVVRGAGHLFPVRGPERFARTVRDFTCGVSP